MLQFAFDALVALFPTGLGQKTKANSLAVTVASDQDVLATSTKQTDGTQKAQTVDGSGNVQPSGDALARSIFVKPGDGTTTIKVVAASTDIAASDPTLAVQLSPSGAVAKAITPQATTLTTLAEVSTAANTTAVQLGSLAAGPRGIVIMAHPNNSITVRLDAHSTASSTRGIPLAPGRAYRYMGTNANQLDVCNESGVISKIEVWAE